jgi:hypothetical protein
VTAVRSMPCSACPYRLDCPAGVWAWEEYEKLRAYDAETWGQPPEGFSCHASPDHFCFGWAVVHTNRGHEFDLMALRIHSPDDGVPEAGKIALFSSGAEAADHGQAGVGAPDDRAVEAISRLVRKHPRIRERQSPGRS